MLARASSSAAKAFRVQVTATFALTHRTFTTTQSRMGGPVEDAIREKVRAACTPPPAPAAELAPGHLPDQC